ncbi:MAG: cytosine methyltransferase [Eubacterium sp.]|jgi:N6-adenosine-specific RNA methylase IME4|nr:cytosine methyltransferase [Eubacterium sp.]
MEQFTNNTTKTMPYRVVVADPPWPKNQKGARGAQKHYNLMSMKEILNLPVGELTADNSVCWLWVTNSTMNEGHEVLRKWGFEPKTILTWFKFRPQPGLGLYLRNNTEHVILGVKGKMPIHVKNQPSWFIAPTGAHSEKPREFFAIAERCYPEEPRLELFARRRQPGWDVWGNEIDSDVIIPGYPVPKYSAKALREEES